MTNPAKDPFPQLSRYRKPVEDRAASRADRAAETEALFLAATECDDASQIATLHERLVLINRGVAEAAASRYRDRGIATDDLHQVAYLGLVKAVSRFDHSRGENFLTYAVPTIRGEIRRHFRDNGWMVRPTRRIQELQWQINRAISELYHQLGREPSAEEVRADLDIDPGHYSEAVQAFGCFQPTSLDQPIGSDAASATLGDLIPDRAVDEVSPRLQLEPVVRHPATETGASSTCGSTKSSPSSRSAPSSA